MLRRFIILTSLAAGTAIAVTAAVATPALAKGATQASITGPGLARPVTISAQGEALPGQGDTLSSLAGQTGLFTVLFGPGSGTPGRAVPAAHAASSGLPRAEVHRYLHGARRHPRTRPGGRADPPVPVPARGRRPGDLHAARTAGLRPAAAGHRMAPRHPAADRHPDPARRTCRRLAPDPASRLRGLPAPAAPAPAAAPKPDDTTAPAWLIATIVSAVAIAIAGTALWLRRRSRPATDRPVTDRPATEETSGEPRREPAVRSE